jgi:hypothetical protein
MVVGGAALGVAVYFDGVGFVDHRSAVARSVMRGHIAIAATIATTIAATSSITAPTIVSGTGFCGGGSDESESRGGGGGEESEFHGRRRY